MKAVIQAGGKGTRLSKITKDEIPKPMVNMLDKPFIFWQLMKLKENGITEIIIIIGHLGHKIKDYFDDGNNFGLRIKYIEEKEPLGTAGAIYFLKKHIAEEDFLFLYGDVYFDIEISKMLDFHISNKSLATLFVHPNSHPYDSDLVILDNSNRVSGFYFKSDIREERYSNCVNAGLYIFNYKILKFFNNPIKTDLEREFLLFLVQEGKPVFAYKSTEYIKDAGTIDRLYQVESDVKSGYYNNKNLRNKQKCIFLDRDGTINIHKGLIYNEEDFELENSAIEAIRTINKSDYLCILVTNQPVVARGLCSENDIINIHKKLETLLGNEGVYIDHIIFCPHHPDRGYEGERIDLKIECSCRKPKIGMINKLKDKYNIDLENSWFVGDTTTDIMTGINAGMKTGLVLTGEAGNDNKFKVSSDLVGINILDVVDKIIKNCRI